MTTPVHDMKVPGDAYEDAFDDLWQQTCLGRLSVAEVREQMLALKERFGASGPVPPMATPRHLQVL
jgi:hypothetical protein